jgi:hypothetical protein
LAADFNFAVDAENGFALRAMGRDALGINRKSPDASPGLSLWKPSQFKFSHYQESYGVRNTLGEVLGF